MRSGDRSFGGLLLIEGLDVVAVRASLDLASPKLGGAAELTVYTTIFALDRGGIASTSQR
jgi:hypothetical protein